MQSDSLSHSGGLILLLFPHFNCFSTLAHMGKAWYTDLINKYVEDTEKR